MARQTSSKRGKAAKKAAAPKKGAAKATKKGAAPRAADSKKKPIELPREKRRLPVPVGAEVVDRAAHEMAKLHGSSERLKSEKREALAGFKAKREGIDQRMGELADTVNKSTELREITCRVKLYVEENIVRVYREDTAAMIEERAATAAERQSDLDTQVTEVKSTAQALTPFVHPQEMAPAPGALKAPEEVGAPAVRPTEDEAAIDDGDEKDPDDAEDGEDPVDGEE